MFPGAMLLDARRAINYSLHPMPEVESESQAKLHHLVIRHSAYYAVLRPDVSDDAKPPLLVAFHGYGQSSERFIAPFESLRDDGMMIAAPQGPNAFYQRATGKVGFVWLTRFKREQARADLLAYMRAFFEDLARNYAYDEERVFVLGFSQGCTQAFRVAAAKLARFRGLIAAGGDLPVDVVKQLDDMERLPVMVVHGRADATVAFEKGEESASTLEQHGFPITRHFFEGGHEIAAPEVQAISDWIRSR